MQTCCAAIFFFFLQIGKLQLCHKQNQQLVKTKNIRNNELNWTRSCIDVLLNMKMAYSYTVGYLFIFFFLLVSSWRQLFELKNETWNTWLSCIEVPKLKWKFDTFSSSSHRKRYVSFIIQSSNQMDGYQWPLEINGYQWR